MTRAMLATLSWRPRLRAAADEVFLKGGGRIVGEVVERSPRSRRHRRRPGHGDAADGRASTASSRARRPGRVPRAARRAWPRATSTGWLALARLGRANDLRHPGPRGLRARRWPSIRRTRPRTPRWATSGSTDNGWTIRERPRARGWSQFDGQWMSPGEREARLAERAAEAAAQRERDRRARSVGEAEARAREAEARARAAEADAARAAERTTDGGIPFRYGTASVTAPSAMAASATVAGVVGTTPGFVDPNVRPGGGPVPRPRVTPAAAA